MGIFSFDNTSFIYTSYSLEEVLSKKDKNTPLIIFSYYESKIRESPLCLENVVIL